MHSILTKHQAPGQVCFTNFSFIVKYLPNHTFDWNWTAKPMCKFKELTRQTNYGIFTFIHQLRCFVA